MVYKFRLLVSSKLCDTKCDSICSYILLVIYSWIILFMSNSDDGSGSIFCIKLSSGKHHNFLPDVV